MVVYATIAFVFVSHLGCAFSLIFACTPVYKSWRPLTEGTCLPPGPSFTAYAVVTIVSDVIVAVLPIPMLLSLNIQLSKKLGLIGIFILGLFTTLCSVFRYLQINRIQYGDGNSTMLILWGVVEFNVGVSDSLTGLSEHPTDTANRTWCPPSPSSHPSSSRRPRSTAPSRHLAPATDDREAATSRAPTPTSSATAATTAAPLSPPTTSPTPAARRISCRATTSSSRSPTRSRWTRTQPRRAPEANSGDGTRWRTGIRFYESFNGCFFAHTIHSRRDWLTTSE